MGIEGGHSIEKRYSLAARLLSAGCSLYDPFLVEYQRVGRFFGRYKTIPRLSTTMGLTDFGKLVVLEMNRLGMMVDISHVG